MLDTIDSYEQKVKELESNAASNQKYIRQLEEDKWSNQERIKELHGMITERVDQFLEDKREIHSFLNKQEKIEKQRQEKSWISLKEPLAGS